MKNFVKALKKTTELLMTTWRTALTVVAILAIIAYTAPLLGITNQWWGFMVCTLASGLAAWLLTPLMENLKIFNTFIPLGINLLFLISFTSFFTNFLFWKIVIIMALTSLIIEIINQWGNKKFWLNLGKNLSFDLVILSARIISYIKNPIFTLFTLLVAYVLIMCVNISFSLKLHFNIKK